MATTPTTTRLELRQRSIRQFRYPSSRREVGFHYCRFAGPMVAAGILGSASVTALAQSFRVDPVVDASFTVSDNIDLAPSDRRKSDLVLQLTPSLRISEKGAHTSLTGTVGAAVLQYARNGGSNVEPQVSLNGTAELLDRLLFVDGSIQIAPSYFSPFGAQPRNLTNTTANRYTSYAYRVSPYIKRDVGGGLHYEVRDDNIWTSARGAPVATDRSYANDLLATITRDPTPIGWSLDYTRNDTRFSNQDSLVSEAERAHALTEQRSDIEGHEALEIEGVGDARILGHGADVVPVIEGGDALGLQAMECLANSTYFLGSALRGSAAFASE